MDYKKDEGMPVAHASGRDGGSASGGDPAVVVGQRLAAVRTEKGRTIDEMASRLKVSPVKVAALEAGDLTPLHDAAFAVGLVRSYAKVLGMDPDPLTDMLRGVRRAVPDLALPPSTAKAASMGARRANVPLSWSTRRSDRRSWIWGGLAAVVVLVLLVVWRVGNEPNGWLLRFRGETPADSATVAANGMGASVPAGTGTSAAPENASTVVSALPALGASTSVAGANVAAAGGQNNATAASGVVITPLTAATAPPTPTGASDSSAAAATLAAVSSAQAGAAAPGAASLPPLSPGASRLTIVATQDTWVGVRSADGRSVFSGMLHSGQSQVVDGAKPLRLTIGNINGIGSIQQDGQAVDLTRYKGNGRTVARLALP